MFIFTKIREEKKMNFLRVFILVVFLNFNHASYCDKKNGTGITFECLLLPGYTRAQYTKCVSNDYIERRSNHKHFCRDLTASHCYYPCMLETFDIDHGTVNENCFCDLSHLLKPQVIVYQTNNGCSNKGFLFFISVFFLI